MNHSGHPHKSRGDGFALPWAKEGVLRLTDVSLVCLTPLDQCSECRLSLGRQSISGPRKSSQTAPFPVLPVTPWAAQAATAELDPPPQSIRVKVIPSWRVTLLGMLRATKQAAGAHPSISGAPLPSGQL